MSKREELLALAERVEAATGPDRMLGREVLLVCGFGYVSPLQRWMDPTASLDAATGLVPEGWTVERAGWHDLGQPCAGFSLSQYRQNDERLWLHGSDEKKSEGRARMPAAALCAAALRARASMETDNG